MDLAEEDVDLRMTSVRAAFVLALVACGTAPPRAAPPPPPPSDPMDLLPPGPLKVVSTHEGETTTETVEDVHFRDAAGAPHALLIHFTSYPILPSLVTLDDKPSARGPAWRRLGQRLIAAGLSNNATQLLICFGAVGAEADRC